MKDFLRKNSSLSGFSKAFVIIVVAYVMAHLLTAKLVTPTQRYFLSEITVFASLVYLPHGVRVLAIWLWGWKAIFPLFTGGMISSLVFTPSEVLSLIEPVMLEANVVGATSALIVFGLASLIGLRLHAEHRTSISWKSLLTVGALASLVNSAGQTFVYSGLILPENILAVFLTYAIGDLIGLTVCMFALMLVFRWLRKFNGRVDAARLR